ncbi:hypothetical protein [Streptomyces griseoloalbus]|uniref:Uncharacterized protein n=1 Tax=Streptomyces griseoloalbus TaxID=67303 RepID=A0A7W8BR20_9ACTN|nr:hypothetical protein [Streptomyces albaduncus]GGW57829.1 hypothetical protein GCM10010340_40260 [Streptomyces albaduncus]
MTEPDPAADAPARLSGVRAVLTRVGVLAPPGLVPGEPADRLFQAARIQRGARSAEEREGGAPSGAPPPADRPAPPSPPRHARDPHPGPRPTGRRPPRRRSRSALGGIAAVAGRKRAPS